MQRRIPLDADASRIDVPRLEPRWVGGPGLGSCLSTFFRRQLLNNMHEPFKTKKKKKEKEKNTSTNRVGFF